MNVITLELPDDLNSALKEVSRKRGLSKSAVVREALEQSLLAQGVVAGRRGKQECSERDGKSETPSLSIGAIGRKPARSKALNRLRSESVPSRYDTR